MATAKKSAKKAARKPAAKKAVAKKATKKAAKKRVAKKAVRKAVAKKGVRKAANKRVAKKATRKAASKRVVKKAAAKRVVKKAAARKVAKKAVAKKRATRAPRIPEPAQITPEQALENTRKLLEAKQAKAHETPPWQALGGDHGANVPHSGFQSDEARDRAVGRAQEELRSEGNVASSAGVERAVVGKRDARD